MPLQGSMQKYFGETGGDDHNGPLSWPGTSEGFPVRGQAPLLTGQEYQNLVHTADFYSKRFELWNPEDHAKFDIIMDRVANGWYRERKRVDRWCDQHGGLIVWLEWVQIYGEYVPQR